MGNTFMLFTFMMLEMLTIRKPTMELIDIAARDIHYL